ncbi:MAG: hypothetical protein ACMUIM_09635 [bacterium]
MRHLSKPFSIFLICFFGILITSSIAGANFPPTGYIVHSMRCEGQPLQVPTWQFPQTGEGDIMIDNFEYWDSPYNHGWRQLEPAFPVYGFGMGYATIFRTILDFQQGNRVLDVYRPPSIFLIGTPNEKHGILYSLFTPPAQGDSSVIQHIDLETHPIVSFKFRAPFGIEPWDIFEFNVIGVTKADYDISIQIRPIQPPAGSPYQGGNSTQQMGGYLSTVVDARIRDGSMSIQVDIGRNYLDGTWHVVWLDLKEVVLSALDRYEGNFGSTNKSDWEISKATRLVIRGQMFRLDNICFRISDHSDLDQPDFFECGPRYAQLFEPYRYLFMADYEANSEIQMLTDILLIPDSLITDQDLIREAWIADLLALDPNYHAIDSTHPHYDPNYTNRWLPGDPNFGTPDPVAERFIRDDFFIDITLPVFADPNLRIAGDQVSEILNHGTLGWNMTVGSYAENAVQAFMINILPINPYDGMPTYIPAYYRTIEVIKAYGKNHYPPARTFALESALWNVGLRLWPNIIYMDYEPQYFEDLIVTLQVTNGHNSDVRTFPISVVNYPVENYPPVVLLHTTNRITYVGEEDEYALRFSDPDCFIFSLAQFRGGIPATTHLPMLPGNQIRTDQDGLTYRMTLNGLASYQYGPWMQSMINPDNGLITITPQFEGAFETIITCTDDRGTSAFGDFTYYTFNPGSWLNHPPINFGNPTRPLVARAGEEIIINYPDLKVMDPDGDEIFAAANMGAVGRTADGGFMWSFQTNFPGTYKVEIIFYDIRGGYNIRPMTVVVKPWWSY